MDTPTEISELGTDGCEFPTPKPPAKKRTPPKTKTTAPKKPKTPPIKKKTAIKRSPSTRTRTKRSPPLNISYQNSHDTSYEPGFYVPVKEVSFKSIGGYKSVVQELLVDVVGPFQRQIASYHEDGAGWNPGLLKGVLFHGPPGTGKTLMAKAVAYECQPEDGLLPVYILSGPDILTKWVGESESHLRAVFQQAEENSPSVIFIDEIDGLVRRRSTGDHDAGNASLVSTLLTLLDGASKRGPVLVIATTNMPDNLDAALLRSGRFDIKIFFPLPNEEERKLILAALTRTWKYPILEANLKTYARNTADFVGADLELLCRRSMLTARERERTSQKKSLLDSVPEPKVLNCDVFAALEKVRPNIRTGCVLLQQKMVHETVEKLIAAQVARIVGQIADYYPIKSSSLSSHSSAAFAKFSLSSVMLEYNGVVFIHRKFHPSLINALGQAICAQLSADNTVHTFDFRDGVNSNKLTRIQELLKQRKGIIALLNMNPRDLEEHAYVNGELRSILLARDRLTAPLLIVISCSNPNEIGKDFADLFGMKALVIRASLPTRGDIRSYFEEMVTQETQKVIDEKGHMVLLNVKQFQKVVFVVKLFELGSALRHTSIETILDCYTVLSRALWADRKLIKKLGFLKELDAMIALYTKAQETGK